MLRRLPTAALLLAVLLSGFLVPGDTSFAPTDVVFPADAALERARQVAAAWPGSEPEQIWRTGYYPFPPQQSWLPTGIGNNRGAFAALLGNRVDLGTDFPAPGGRGTVSFPDGRTLSLPLTDPRAHYEQYLARPRDTCTSEPCNTRITVTAVRLATRPQVTSRGTATVPVREFDLAGVQEPYAIVAVDSQQPTGLRYTEDDENLPAGISDVSYAYRDYDNAWQLKGELGPRNCAEALPGAVYETADVLVLVGRTTGRPGDCETRSGRYPRFAFARPLGDRVVLNLAGRPVLFPELVPES
ncbi:hypothetical protein [Kitasatospora purpeofusca]|uniref:hypothetical protein n=1 Tax=Kitasatospora purpeofusca TaxID=67352 RepID=UPI0036A83D7C